MTKFSLFRAHSVLFRAGGAELIKTAIVEFKSALYLTNLTTPYNATPKQPIPKPFKKMKNHITDSYQKQSQTIPSHPNYAKPYIVKPTIPNIHFDDLRRTYMSRGF